MAVTDTATIQYFKGFCEKLRQENLNISPHHTSIFLLASRCIQLEKLDEIYWSGRAILIGHVEDIAIYDQVFATYFQMQGQQNFGIGGQDGQVKKSEDDDAVMDSIVRKDEKDQFELIDGVGSSKQASLGEALITKNLQSATEKDLYYIRKIINLIEHSSPLFKGRRKKKSNTGSTIDLRRSIKRILKTDGELIKLLRKTRKKRKRSATILIDVSGSMALQIRANLFFAYGMIQGLERCEVFCVGTRLTSVTQELKARNLDTAMDNIAARVLDWEGGTRLGESMKVFLSHDHQVSMVRGAEIFIVSDGLERGDPEFLIKSIETIAKNSASLHWLSPLASHSEYSPQTRAMLSIASMCGPIYPSANLEDIYTSLLSIWT